MSLAKSLARLLTIATLSIASSLCATPTADGIYAVFQTNNGSFTAELYYELAPLSCANMVGLAEGAIPHYAAGSTTPIYSNYYNSLNFHRVVDGFVIQGGDPLGNGTGGPGYSWPDEVRPELKHLAEGYLSMANSGTNTNGSQFFVTLAATPHLDGIHNVFGKVVEGIETVRAIGKVATNAADTPISPVVINSLTILRIGEAANAFDPLFYSNYFDPDPFLFGEPVQNDLQLVNASPNEITVSAPFKPLVDYRVLVSENLEDWTEVERFPPSLDPNNAAASYTLKPIARTSPEFVQIVTTKGLLTDISGVLQSVTITSQDATSTFNETITFSPGLIGTYKLNTNQELSIQYDWMEISADRTQLLVRFTNDSAIQFYLNKNGTAYIRDGSFIAEGTFAKTVAP